MAFQNENMAKDTAFINIRKLAALDNVLHGPKLILTEFVFGVFFSAGLGLFLLYTGILLGHFHSLSTVILGGWLIFLALNYLPLLLYAITIVRRASAASEVAVELATDKDKFTRKYTLQSLLLVVPVLVPLLALVQEMQRRR